VLRVRESLHVSPTY